MGPSSSIGLIADTHGFLDPRIGPIFSGVAHIVHAGDVGDRSVLTQLQRLASTTAVAGNVDTSIALPQTALLDFRGHRLLIQHIVDPLRPSSEFARTLLESQATIVVFGHTHRTCADWIGGRFFVNPGSAGRRRWNIPRSIAILTIEAEGPHIEFHTLSD